MVLLVWLGQSLLVALGFAHHRDLASWLRWLHDSSLFWGGVSSLNCLIQGDLHGLRQRSKRKQKHVCLQLVRYCKVEDGWDSVIEDGPTQKCSHGKVWELGSSVHSVYWNEFSLCFLVWYVSLTLLHMFLLAICVSFSKMTLCVFCLLTH